MSDVAAVRGFNRFYTRQLGLLEEHVAKTSFTLAEGRVLYEIARTQPTSATALAEELGLDPAYLSRLLKILTNRRLISVTQNVGDRRRTDIRMTAEGTAGVAEIDRLNDAAVEALLSGLSAEGRQTLVGAMQSIRALLGGGERRGPIVLRPHRLGEIGWLIHRQGLAYNQQYGWNIEFEGLIARIYGDYQSAPADPPRNLWIAEQDGAIAGSIFVQPSDGLPGSAQLRMLFVEPAARGRGIGTALVRQAVSFARDNGYNRMRLWTHENQSAARKLYEAAGFEIVETMPESNFGKQLLGEIWEMRF